MNNTWVAASSSSAKQNRSKPWRMNSSGGQPKVVTSVDGREVMSVVMVPSRGPAALGAYNCTLVNGPGADTPKPCHCLTASARPGSLALAQSKCSKSSPLTENTNARTCSAQKPSSAMPWSVSNSMYNKNKT